MKREYIQTEISHLRKMCLAKRSVALEYDENVSGFVIVLNRLSTPQGPPLTWVIKRDWLDSLDGADKTGDVFMDIYNQIMVLSL